MHKIEHQESKRKLVFCSLCAKQPNVCNFASFASFYKWKTPYRIVYSLSGQGQVCKNLTPDCGRLASEKSSLALLTHFQAFLDHKGEQAVKEPPKGYLCIFQGHLIPYRRGCSSV